MTREAQEIVEALARKAKYRYQNEGELMVYSIAQTFAPVAELIEAAQKVDLLKYTDLAVALTRLRDAAGHSK